MRTWLTLPNLFTLARLLLAPVIVCAILNRRAFAALAIFAVAAATDVIDGYLARQFGAATAAGAFLDPIADKLLLTGVYLALALAGRGPWWLVGVIFGRDLLILSAMAAGAFLDPIADKLLLTGVYLALALAGSVPWWLVGVIFGRDLLILAASAVALLATKLRAFPPSIWGKASTFLQILTAVAFLGRGAFGSTFLAALSDALIWPTLALTVWSGAHYGWRGARLLRMD